MQFGTGAGQQTTSTTQSNTTVNVATNVTGPPINVSVGSEFLQPVASAFRPIADQFASQSVSATGVLRDASAGFREALRTFESQRQQQDQNIALLVESQSKNFKLLLLALGAGAIILVVVRK